MISTDDSHTMFQIAVESFTHHRAEMVPFISRPIMNIALASDDVSLPCQLSPTLVSLNYGFRSNTSIRIPRQVAFIFTGTEQELAEV